MPNRVRLYRFFNMELNRDGAPFAMCDQHRASYRVPDKCVMHTLSNESLIPCNTCEAGEIIHDPPAAPQGGRGRDDRGDASQNRRDDAGRDGLPVAVRLGRITILQGRDRKILRQSLQAAEKGGFTPEISKRIG